MSDVAFAPLSELAARIAARETSPLEIVSLYLDRIEALDGNLRAFVTVRRDEALAEARRAEAQVQEHARAGTQPPPLAGIPIALKDLFDTAGIRTAAGSRILDRHVPDQDATVVARLRAAGAIVLGKLHMHEFAYGPEGRNEHLGNARNPWDPRVHRIPGGSSSGSAIAVAAGLCAGALGSDTGGSIRLPSALCNVTGLKPTYGRTSRAGVVPLAWSLDHVGPMTRTARDAALLLKIIAGPDERDPSASDAPVPDYVAALTGDVRGLRLGLLRRFFLERATPPVSAAVASAARQLELKGAHIEEVEIDDVAHVAGASLAILWPEALAFHKKWLDTRPGDYTAPVRDRLRLGFFVSGSEYVDGQRMRQRLRRQVDALFDRVDVLLAPACPIVAGPLFEDEIELGGERRDRRGALILFTQPFNLTGHPAGVVPCGFSADGMPIGLQIVGRAFDEATVLRVADAFQRITDFHLRRPPAV